MHCASNCLYCSTISFMSAVLDGHSPETKTRNKTESLSPSRVEVGFWVRWISSEAIQTEQLGTIRRKFVESVSKPVISELLDDLLQDGILNDEEKDFIVEEDHDRADRARGLIDIVKRKGDEASKKMIAHIKRADPTLYSKLVLSRAEPPAKEKQKITQEQLGTIRRKFVESVSKPVISELLDDLLQDGILNDEEKDFIVEEDHDRADRARGLIDIVKRKGDEASKKMIAHIKQTDPTLYSKLVLSRAEPPAKEKQKITQEQLGTIRRKFVESVSEPVISELLDDLLQDGILNDEEKDFIVEEDHDRADRARGLIDIVKRKGDEASKKMIAHIKRADPTLYSELVLSHAEPPAKEKQKITQEQLGTIRRKFVESVSKPVISELLDDLLQDGILNDEEKDFIVEEDHDRADRARGLIDIVKRKGDEASKKMIAHLQQTDPTLYSELVLSRAEPPAKEKQKITHEQLGTIRRKFVESVSKPVISELLDDLLQDGILNDEEKDFIVEEDHDRADRARGLIDIVKRKGDEASKKMIAHLQQTDPTLYSELVLSHAEPPAKEKQKMTLDETDNDIYPVTKENVKNRVALLITNITFTNVMYNRGGADIDEKNMEKLLSSLGYEVVKHTDLTAEQIHKAVLDFSKHPKLRQTDSVWVVMMSHGKLGNILGVNYNEDDAKPDQFSINNIYTCLDSAHCPALLNKPKVIVMRRFEDFSKGKIRQMPTKDRCTLTKHFYVFPQKELGRVRGRFVDKVSKPLLKQLLDDLLEDGLLNDGEKDSVLEDHTGKADMARALVDMVRKKGDRASRKMIAHLEDRDPTLHAELGLSCGPAARPTGPSWSNKLIATTDALWKEKVNDKNVYPVSENQIKSRVALLITNRNFLNEKMNRYGAEKDEENMERLLASLRYEVVKHRDLTAKGMDDALIRFSKHPKLRATDSVFVVIMSHGKLGAVLGVNAQAEEPDELPIDNIYKHLGTEECPALLNKPKIIIIQACRGENKGAVLVSDVVCDDSSCSGAAGEDHIVDDALLVAHKEKDFASLLSSTPDTVSYRETNRGSFLIQYLVEIFNTCSHEDDIDELFRKVMQRFEEFPCETKRQMPTKDRCTLTKRFYLFPGH
ncbi:uncharacterized protein LOC114868231 [Betta splendens]|uniref:Uncharacterized protein LOC114868231 n=1 Tax=Betta splendens TaxID=158456 RepID=A0A9W2Y8A0_BETSP|nr:uncharacterized protein LOC114868231 [Betta splendens]